ncbi:hypothetical protein C5167_014766 [Papaver somniferum]|uniref:Uncharacterized protein n=1 Tax=Papaver somniferum TaxID=3469 RepID=A0A4Y7J527_PAPSO|nr:hypothetical protein MKW92_034344 [Papaver armeniacum]RZC55907.1 hypothetical protein C5167_014766 [Papaver somniferum]
MAKISMFLSFFLFVLIVMPTSSSSSRMMLEEVEAVNKCPKPNCSFVKCKPFSCVQVVLKCPNGQYTPCCSCPKCCPV